MARDIEEFLRRAAERRQQQNQRQPAAPQPPSQRIRNIIETADVEVISQDVEVVEPRKSAEKTRPEVKRRRADLRDVSVGDHVQQHINTKAISDHAQGLGHDIQLADDRITDRVNKKFDHDVSKLDDLPTVQDDLVATVTQANVSPMVRDLVAMLQSPNTVRQAILISEILNRPNFD